MMRHAGRLSDDEQALIDPCGDLPRSASSHGRRAEIGPIRKIKRAWCSNRPLLERAKRPDIHPAKLRNQIDIGGPAERVRDGVASMVKRSSAVRMSRHTRCV